MDLLWHGLREAFALLTAGEPEVRAIAWRSLEVSGTATLLSLLTGVPAGVMLAFARFPGRRLVVALVNTGMALPPVVVGLFISILLWRSGPLGFLELLYTPGAMVLAQVVIAFPIVAGLTLAAVQQLNPNLRLQLLALGASRLQLLALLCDCPCWRPSWPASVRSSRRWAPP
jgi:tungstate transport system permease protein